MKDIDIKEKDGRASIYTPFNPVFLDAIRGVNDSKWNHDEKCWSVPMSEVDVVRKFMLDVFGRSDITLADVVTIRLTAIEKADACRGDLIFANKVLSHATGRDSGAKTGYDVSLIHGNVKSGGSVKNWLSIAEEGSVFILRNVNRAVLKNQEDTDFFTYEIIEDEKPRRSDLLEEKEILLKRLDQINKLLNGCQEDI